MVTDLISAGAIANVNEKNNGIVARDGMPSIKPLEASILLTITEPVTVTVTHVETNCDVIVPPTETPKVTTEGPTSIMPPSSTVVDIPTTVDMPTFTQSTDVTMSTTVVQTSATHTSESKTEKATTTVTDAPPVPTNGAGYVNSGVFPIAVAAIMAAFSLF